MKLNVIYKYDEMAQLAKSQADKYCAALFSCSWDVGVCMFVLLSW